MQPQTKGPEPINLTSALLMQAQAANSSAMVKEKNAEKLELLDVLSDMWEFVRSQDLTEECKAFLLQKELEK